MVLFSHHVSLTGALDSVVTPLWIPLWIPLLYILTVGSLAPFVLLFIALRHTSATAVGIGASSKVLFAFGVALLWRGETLTPLQIAGAAVVLGGIILAQTARQSVTSPLELPALGEMARPSE